MRSMVDILTFKARQTLCTQTAYAMSCAWFHIGIGDMHVVLFLSLDNIPNCSWYVSI